jgi:predicted Zn-dependent protease
VAGVQLWAGWHERKARQLIASYDFDAAYSHYVQSLRVWNNRPAVQLGAARAARRAGKLEQAEKHLEASRKLAEILSGSQREELLFEVQLEWILLELQKDNPTFLPALQQEYAGRDTPETHLVKEVLAEVYLRHDQKENALKELEWLLQRDPDNVVALYLKGQVLAIHSRPVDAIELFQRVLALQPHHLEARKELCTLLQDEHPADALEHLRYLLERNPTDPRLRLSEAICLQELGKPEDAARVLDKLLAEKPNHSAALVTRGTLALEVSDPGAAKKYLKKALESEPFNQDGNYKLAEALLQLGEQKEAEQQRAFCRRLSSDFARMEAIQAMGMKKLGGSPDLLCECGEIMLRYRNEQQGLTLLFRALEVNQGHQATHRLLADYFDRKGNKERADEHRRALRKQEGGKQ